VTELLIRKLQSIGSLTPEQCVAIRALEASLVSVDAHQDVVREGDQPNAVTLLVHGFLCRYKIVADGKRQIMSFHIPGDVPDLAALFVRVMDHNLCSLVPSQLALIPRAAMLALFAQQPQLAYLFWRDTLIDAAVFREWMVGIGRRSAFKRIAHLFCEMIVRMQAVGLSSNYSIELPLTQTDIADALVPFHGARQPHFAGDPTRRAHQFPARQAGRRELAGVARGRRVRAGLSAQAGDGAQTRQGTEDFICRPASTDF